MGAWPSPRLAASRTSSPFRPCFRASVPAGLTAPAWDRALSSRRLPRAWSDALVHDVPSTGGRVCLLTRLLPRDPWGSARSLGTQGASQGYHVIRTLHTAEGWGRRAAASSQRFPPRRVGERPAAPVRPRMRRSPAPASSSWAREGP